ncbi:glutathione peroxidase 9 [Polypterus senegalus]|uniref:glutathione peroxidase 9 n=1 Tax=Polypterus senegalus TaxID=55291 RepID=UPI001966A6A1|nr:glutathione peroxidase 9 [Polypterus senegalus]
MDKFTGTSFTVLGFPCNQFGLQEPEENYETLNVLKYVRPGGGFIPRFQVFGKLEVNGADEHPLFTFLKESCSFVNPLIGDPKRLYWSPMKVSDIRWNFEKFLILPNGVPFKRYDLNYPIEMLENDISTLLETVDVHDH